VRRWTFRLVGPRADLDDVSQEALTEVARALRSFRGESSLSTFARKITVRVAYRHLRRTPPPSPDLSVVGDEDAIDLEERILGREALRRLYRCLDRLPRRRRIAFVLCAIEGFEPSQAAELEGITAVAMRSRLRHARAELGRMLRGDPFFGPLVGGEG
jgi:RNA polymerase sigma-70 factor (ECF subfamily)